MEVTYRNAQVKKACTDYKKATKLYNKDVAEKLQKAINFIDAAESLMDVRNFPPFHFHQLKGDKKGYCAIDLGRRLGFRLLVVPLEADGQPCANTRIFSSAAVEIIAIEIEEVSNHYE